MTQKIAPQAVSSASALAGGVLFFAGRGVLSGVPLTLTSGTTFVMAIALALLVPDCSEVEVLGRSEEEVERLVEEPGGPKVAEERAIEGVELGTGERLPAFATAILWVGLF